METLSSIVQLSSCCLVAGGAVMFLPLRTTITSAYAATWWIVLQWRLVASNSVRGGLIGPDGQLATCLFVNSTILRCLAPGTQTDRWRSLQARYTIDTLSIVTGVPPPPRRTWRCPLLAAFQRRATEQNAHSGLQHAEVPIRSRSTVVLVGGAVTA
jgi:hypothetical protein